MPKERGLKMLEAHDFDRGDYRELQGTILSFPSGENPKIARCEDISVIAGFDAEEHECICTVLFSYCGEVVDEFIRAFDSEDETLDFFNQFIANFPEDTGTEFELALGQHFEANGLEKIY